MGASYHKPTDAGRAERRGSRIAAALCVAWVLCAPGSASAEDPAEAPPPAEQPVSTSPLANRADADAVAPTRATPIRLERPLTRAAARRITESITPVAWLTRFGQVDVTPRE